MSTTIEFCDCVSLSTGSLFFCDDHNCPYIFDRYCATVWIHINHIRCFSIFQFIRYWIGIYTAGNPAGTNVTYALKAGSPTDVISVEPNGLVSIYNASMNTQIGKVIVEATSHDPNGNYSDKTIELPNISCALMIGVTLPFPFCAAVTP